MAVNMKQNVVHALACNVLLVFLLNPYIKLCVTSTTTEPLTSTDLITTENATVAENTTITTTTPTTTTPTTPPTTTPVPTEPPSAIPSNTDLGTCPCDVTGNACDINCCCDNDCTTADFNAFTECLPFSRSVDDRLCIQSDLLLLDNAPFTRNYSQDGLFCIYFDNYPQRNYYNIPDFVTENTTFSDYLNNYAGPTFLPGYSLSTAYPTLYKTGDPVFVVYNSLASGYLNIPRRLGSNLCTDNNPTAFLKDESFDCVRPLSSLTQATCEQTPYLSASSYYSGIKVVATPYLFTWVINGTETTTRPPTTTTTTTTTTTPPPVTGNATDTNETTAAVVTTTTTPTTTPTTTTTDFNDTTTETVTTTVPVTMATTAAAAFDVLNLYNNSYTIPIDLDTVECRNASGVIIDCPFTGDPPSPAFNAGVCDNVVLQVEYILTHDGVNGITRAQVRFIIGSVDSNSLPMTQTFVANYQGANDTNVLERSGNPGYVVGKPVRAGIRVQNATANKLVIEENTYDLTLVKSSATGSCLTDAADRVHVNFGENLRTGCLLRFNLGSLNVSEYCATMRAAIIDALEGLNDTINRDNPNNFNRYVATFGNSDTLKTGDWVPIFRQNFPPSTVARGQTVEGPTCQLSMGMHVLILYANVGSLVNPQAKIIGVSFIYEEVQTITYRCVGTYCQAGNDELIQSFEVSQSVSFVEVSQPAVGIVGEPPIFLAKVPYDFWYPFLSSSSQAVLYNNYLLLTCLLFIKQFITMKL